jgi:proteasome lid subunit RPN8/RPN11
MEVKESGLHFQFVSWRVPQFPRAIEYPPEVIDEIRAFASDELLQLSSGGQEVGGVLFGTRRDDLIRILTWRPIACEHTQGEGLRLSYNDRMNLAVQLEMARQNPDLKDLRPLGWFVSHLNGSVSLSPTDLETYNGFFPEAWQVTLVICPQGSGCAQAGFFVREADQKVQSESSYQCFELKPLQPSPSPTAVAPPAPEAAPIAKPVQADVPVRVTRVTPVEPAEPVSLTPARETRAPVLPSPSFPSPSFEIDERVPTHERWLWAIPVLLALGIAGFMLYQRRAPSPNSAIALRASNEAQTVQLAWDASSRAVRDSDRGEIEIQDGGRNSQVSLTADQLRAGKMSYLPQSGDVSFVMTIYPANGEPLHDSTRFLAPLFHAPTEPPQLLTTGPPAAPNSERDALQRQVQQLKDDLGKERAHATELQNLVRILENRLGIPSENPASEQRR